MKYDYTQIANQITDAEILGDKPPPRIAGDVASSPSSSHTGPRGGHAFWRVTQIEQLRLLQALALPLSVAAAHPRHHHDLLEVRRVDEELHLDARALHHVPEDKRRVGPAPPDGDEHARKCRRRVREIDGEH